MSLSPDYSRDWPQYFDAVSSQPARQTLVSALGHVDATRRGLLALDIACGEGRDTRAILAHSPSWKVVSLDTSTEGLVRLQGSLSNAHASRVRAACVSMEDLPAWWAREMGGEALHLVNASFALPFCAPTRFPALWAFLRETLAPGGCLACQLFGERDDWAAIDPLRHHTRTQVDAMLAGLEVLMLDEVEKDGSDAMGGVKHHHVFHCVARRWA